MKTTFYEIEEMLSEKNSTSYLNNPTTPIAGRPSES